MPKRENYLIWDECFMMAAKTIAMRSKDPSTQAGAVIVSGGKQPRIVACGYNGFPIGCSDDEFPWERSVDFHNSKTTYVVHAELNAILNFNGAAGGTLNNASLYTTLFPCHECAKAIIQVGIKNVYYLEDGNMNYQDSFIASRKMFQAAGVQWKQLKIKNPMKGFSW